MIVLTWHETQPYVKPTCRSTIQVTSSMVVMSDKINACSVYMQKAYLRAARVSVDPCPRDQLKAKDADVTSLPN